jgi:hypothetical protein
MAVAAFSALCRLVGADHGNVPTCRLLKRSVVGYVLQHRHPTVIYRHLAETTGFVRAAVECPSAVPSPPVGFLESVECGMRALVSNTQTPMRLVTTLSLFGAAANILYSIYVLAVGIFKADVEPGWMSLSLQQSGMFFLISLVLLVLGEYILHVVNLANDGPPYHIAQEFSSAPASRSARRNVEVGHSGDG